MTKTSPDHAFVDDPRNENIKIGIRNGMSMKFEIFHRAEANISVFDSSVLLGDGIWEGMRAKLGNIQFAKEHLKRLYESANALWIDIGITPKEMLQLLYDTIDANEGMSEDTNVHIRLVVSRGLKKTPYQGLSANIGKATIIIIPEYKKIDPDSQKQGISLITSWVRRGNSDTKDEQWNHLSKATDVSASISASMVGADGALMLDNNGFVKTCNATNFFIVRDGELWTATKDNIMRGITRQKTIDCAKIEGITVRETNFTLTDVYNAEEAFCTGTFAGQVHVKSVDGHLIGNGCSGPLTKRINLRYEQMSLENTSRSRLSTLSEI
ncbi:hypothetical protein KL930_004994 [Ogataea haglerorum]|uniref:uncharacterized protein n=1 Tax=Ogataea haglerorum TaxID=1937702 RepID=UPI001C891299|nr:uncharacterized protein KL911_004885 [Ogataea haglerorum]KAG7699885.1 hypothetical protein KL951_001602 [Ogataea haglerorum]KAG7703162.1 hypothetical protein KL914_004943 [Ogataea haglerorum]KAG7749799.1 hypothetical protein KL912_001800 [Ogataea haglerorum]KAG7749892.1 hypothetical protein KL911_004885 [Ogataea haglerorum]KAG7754501.1 hypothetical protein KL947_004901 [Ogataea haglerorum]